MAGNTDVVHKGNRPTRRRGLVELILCLIILGDIIVLWWATDRPQGLAPADPADRRRLVSTPLEAGSNSPAEFTPDGVAILQPALALETTRSSGSDKYEVLGYGRSGEALYLAVRLHESIDFSLRKGWGWNFLLVDNKGNKFLYDSTGLPNAVEIHDTFVDLPNDIRARQTVPPGGFRDLLLKFPGFPGRTTPDRLKLIEYFAGNSPANPGITYEDVKIEKTGEVEDLKTVVATAPGIKDYRGDGSASDGASFTVQQVLVEPDWHWRVTLDVQAAKTGVLAINDALLIDARGAGFNMTRSEEAVRVELDGDGKGACSLVFEPLPESAAGLSLWLSYTSPAGEPGEIQFPLKPGM